MLKLHRESMKRWQVMTLDGVQLFIASSTYPLLSRECRPSYIGLTMKSTLMLLLKLSTILGSSSVLDIDEPISIISEETHRFPRVNKIGDCDSQFDCHRDKIKIFINIFIIKYIHKMLQLIKLFVY